MDKYQELLGVFKAEEVFTAQGVRVLLLQKEYFILDLFSHYAEFSSGEMKAWLDNMIMAVKWEIEIAYDNV